MATAYVYAVSFVSGGVLSPNNALGLSDGVYTGDANTGNSWTGRWRMGTLPDEITLTGLQYFTLSVSTGSNSGEATIDAVNVYKNGTLVANIVGSAQVVNFARNLDFTIDGALLGDETNVDIELVTTGSGGSPNSRDAIILDAIRWFMSYNIVLPPGTFLNYWDGAAWVTGELKRWDGAAWKPAVVQRWDGNSWVPA